jgi:phosphoserine phosphatase RsbU/P
LTLDRGWRVGISSDPTATEPGFDDSKWAVRDAKNNIGEALDEDQSATPGPSAGRPSSRLRRYVWFRLHIRLAQGHGPIALFIRMPVTQAFSFDVSANGPGVGVRVFANGRIIEPEGPHPDAPDRYHEISRVYDLGVAPDQTSLILAIRTLYVPFGLAAYTSFFADRNLRLGNPSDLRRELELWFNRSLFEHLPHLVYSILLIVLAGFLFALYFAQRGHPEYLWLGLHELAQAPIGFVELAGSTARLDSLWSAAMVLQLLLLSAFLFFEFLIAFLYLRPRWYIRWLRYTAPILAGIAPSLLFIGHGSLDAAALAVVLPLSMLWFVGWSVFVFVTLATAALRRNFEAGLFLVPLVFNLIGIASDLNGRSYQPPLTLVAGPIPIHFASIADFSGILVIVIIIFGRFLRIHREQQRVSNELEAARSVQELLIPREKIATPGFEVDSVYTPANEVGGDFFHVQAAPDGGMLVVIGDVAGKGLKAAMNVSMLMGALRRSQEHRPAQLLDSLNRVLSGSECYTTCQVARFSGNGELILANAGHLPPYLNSQEIDVPGGLPLGFLPTVGYDEVRLYLHPGDRVLLISDGVVEARRPSGELFGFDRVHNLSSQSAFYIADAARSFGQQDDITVLTVRRLADPAVTQESLATMASLDTAPAT